MKQSFYLVIINAIINKCYINKCCMFYKLQQLVYLCAQLMLAVYMNLLNTFVTMLSYVYLVELYNFVCILTAFVMFIDIWKSDEMCILLIYIYQNLM